MRIIVTLAMSLPSILVAGVTAYWAVTTSGWWLWGTAASLLLAPSFTGEDKGEDN